MKSHKRVKRVSKDYFCFYSFFQDSQFYYSSNRSKRPNFITKNETQYMKGAVNCPFCKIDKDLAPIKGALINGVAHWYPTTIKGYKNLKNGSVFTVNNLYEIIPFSYWKAKYPDLNVLLKNREWIDIVVKEKKEFFLNNNINREYLFYGQHNLNIFKNHYKNNEVACKYNMSFEELCDYYLMGFETLKEMLKENQYVKEVVWFENFLSNAGASIEHLHRQLIAKDEHSKASKNLNSIGFSGIDNLVIEPAINSDLVIKNIENIYVLSGVGYNFPTIEVFILDKEKDFFVLIEKNFINLIKAFEWIYKKIGYNVSYNENFYFDFNTNFYPFFTISLRHSKIAGYELSQFPDGYSQISPFDLKDILV